MHGRTAGRVAVIAILTVFLTAGSAWAVLQPLDGQVNNDPAAGIDPTKSVDTSDPTNADVVGGSLAGGVPVPWAIFRQQETPGKDQVFVRSFASGAWTTRGNGTVGGKSSASPTFSGSLNFDQAKDGEVPSIDFAGASRAVPWATWYEDTSAFANAKNIFASRFDSTAGDPNQNKWIFAGQERGLDGSVPVPSLNINTNRDAENPVVAGGAAAGGDPTKPGPWITWQELGNAAPGVGKDQIFVVKPIGPGTTTCPAGTKPAPTGAGTVVGGFCWQQVGIERLGPDPSLNVDRSRDGIEPDMAFTGNVNGQADAVPWVVWYEVGPTGAGGVPGGHTNEMVFAAKGVADTSAGTDGGFKWTAVGTGGTGDLNNSAGGPCAASATAEAACSLNKNPANDAEDPRVAAGTMTPGQPTVPWVTWDESVGGVTQIFVARLVNGDHFELANNGQPISLDSNPSTRPDITFSGNTPYVSWRENTGGSVDKAFVGHFVDASNPTFVLDQSNIPLTPNTGGTGADIREPISSGCTADPFSQDGSVCQGGAVGTPFFLFTNDATAGLHSLFGDGYQTDAPATGVASNIAGTTADVAGTVNPEGGPATVQFQFGTDTNYTLGTTTAQRIAPANTAQPFSATLSGLPSQTTIHYRAVANTDFGQVVGPDATFKTADVTPPVVKLSVPDTSINDLLNSGKLKVKVKDDSAGSATVSAAKAKGKAKKSKALFKNAKLTFKKAGTKTAKLKLTKAGRKFFKKKSKAKVKITAKVKDSAGNKSTKTKTVKLKRKK